MYDAGGKVMSNRIQANCHTGKGDLGTSNLLSGWTIRKSSHVCSLQNEIEVLRNLFSEYLLEYCQPEKYWWQRLIRKVKNFFGVSTPSIDDGDLSHLHYYKLNLHNLSSLVYFRFNNLQYTVTSDRLLRLAQRHDYITAQIQPAKDFIIPETQRSLALDRIRVQVRKVEHLMWVVIDTLYGEFLDDCNECIQRTAAEFNLLSNYLYNLNRYEGLKQNQPELYWQSK
jgi:cob(I)alamin adenosyltransferase